MYALTQNTLLCGVRVLVCVRHCAPTKVSRTNENFTPSKKDVSRGHFGGNVRSDFNERGSAWFTVISLFPSGRVCLQVRFAIIMSEHFFSN